MSRIRRNNYIILIILALMFISPGVTAYLFYTHPQWLQGQRVNKGLLLNPPELLENMPNQSKWRLILWHPGDCQEECLAQIDKLARVRLALGRRLLNVDELIIMNSQSKFPVSLNAKLRDQDIHLLLMSKEQQTRQKLFDEQVRVFIANPTNYLVLAYKLNAKPEDIFHDIQQLLNTSEKGS